MNGNSGRMKLKTLTLFEKRCKHSYNVFLKQTAIAFILTRVEILRHISAILLYLPIRKCEANIIEDYVRMDVSYIVSYNPMAKRRRGVKMVWYTVYFWRKGSRKIRSKVPVKRRRNVILNETKIVENAYLHFLVSITRKVLFLLNQY